jgi:formylglycine-generating enzyme required for sulfatase activity
MLDPVTGSPHLRTLLAERMSLSDVQAICFDLAVDFEDLGGSAKSDRLIALLKRLDREGRLSDLVAWGREQRPDIPWDEIQAEVASGTLLAGPRLFFEPETVVVPEGPFLMGSDGHTEREKPQHAIVLSGYRIGKYPVTNREYAEFLKRNPDVSQPAGWYLRNSPPTKEDHPVTAVVWHSAATYCEWLRQETGLFYRLPTEAEWEKAARGVDGRLYPWGDVWEDNRCNVAGQETTAVTAFAAGASPYGCLDLMGNVQEWTSTIWGSDPQINSYPYPYRSDDGREDKVAEQSLYRVYRVHRGCSYKETPANVRASARGISDIGGAVPWRGFRVVRALQ